MAGRIGSSTSCPLAKANQDEATAALAMVSVASPAVERAEREQAARSATVRRTATAISAPGAQSGRVRNMPLEDLVDDLGMHLHARHGHRERRRDDVPQADGAAADEHDPAGDAVGKRRRGCPGPARWRRRCAARSGCRNSRPGNRRPGRSAFRRSPTFSAVMAARPVLASPLAPVARMMIEPAPCAVRSASIERAG